MTEPHQYWIKDQLDIGRPEETGPAPALAGPSVDGHKSIHMGVRPFVAGLAVVDAWIVQAVTVDVGTPQRGNE